MKVIIFFSFTVKTKVCFNRVTSIVWQIKKIELYSIDLNHVYGQFIAKSISNDGELVLSGCKITKPGYEAFNFLLGDKQVIRKVLIKTY